MPKNKRPAPRKSSVSPEQKEDVLTQKLCDLAIELVEQEDSASLSDSLRQKESDFNKLIKKSLYQKKDELLYESLERAKDADIGAWQLLKERIEEAAEIIVTARADGKNVEVNAFVIPLFVHTVGGLDRERCFQDQEAFELLTASFQQAQLESRDATVVLVSHAYHLDEIDALTFSHLNEMVRDAQASMADKRGAPTSAIERSITGWPDNHFAPDDQAVELRFLLGFSSKTTDDAFYRVPEDEAAADAYFEARAERFARWSEQCAPLVKRCLVADGAGYMGDREIDLNFLYQDLFHGGKERAIAELFLLQMMSELNQALDERGLDPQGVKAIVGPADVRGETVLRVNLYALTDGSDAASLACAEKPWNIGRDLEVEVADIHDALTTIGVASLSLAAKFNADGLALNVREYVREYEREDLA